MDDDRFYQSRRWQKLRARQLQRQPLCVLCLDAGKVTEGKVADHVLERKERPDLQWTLSNLRTLCMPCHNRRHHGRERMTINAEGGHAPPRLTAAQT